MRLGVIRPFRPLRPYLFLSSLARECIHQCIYLKCKHGPEQVAELMTDDDTFEFAEQATTGRRLESRLDIIQALVTKWAAIRWERQMRFSILNDIVKVPRMRNRFNCLLPLISILIYYHCEQKIQFE